MLFRILLVIWLSVFFNESVLASENKITINVVTENTFPLQYLEGEAVKGPATELLEAVLQQAGVEYQIQVLPWARAYQIAKQQKNTLIYSIARTPDREQQFHWLGEVLSLDYYLFGLTARQKSEEKRSSRIGAVRGSVAQEYLENNGYKNLQIVSHPKQNIQMLLSERIDYIPANAASFYSACKRFELTCDQIMPIHKLDMPATDLYFAFSKNTDVNLVTKVKAAYQRVIDQNTKYLIALKQLNTSPQAYFN